MRKINKKIVLDVLKENWYLFFLFVTSLILRTIYLDDTIAISVDQVDQLKFAREIFANYGYIWHGAKIRGKICDGQEIVAYLGPFYAYLIALPAKLNHWNFYGPTLLNGILGALAIIPFYYLTKLLTNKTAAYIAATLFAFSTTFIVASRTLWNPYFLPLFIFVTILSFVKLIQGKDGYLLVFILFLSFSAQLHASAFLFIPALVLLWWIYKIKIKHKIFWLYGGIVLTLSYLPMIYYELTHRFENLTNIFKMLLEPSACENSKLAFFQNIVSSSVKFSESLSITLVKRVYESAWGLWSNRAWEWTAMYLIGVIFFCLYFGLLVKVFKSDWRKNLLLIPIVLIFFFVFGSAFFSYELYVYYFIGIIPLAYIIIAYWLAHLSKNPVGKIFVILILLIFALANVNSFLDYVKARQQRVYAKDLMLPDMLLRDKMELLDYVKKDTLQPVQFEYELKYANDEEVYNYLINLKDIKTKPRGNIVYLIVDPRTENLERRLEGRKILLDQNFGSVRLIKYQGY